MAVDRDGVGKIQAVDEARVGRGKSEERTEGTVYMQPQTVAATDVGDLSQRVARTRVGGGGMRDDDCRVRTPASWSCSIAATRSGTLSRNSSSTATGKRTLRRARVFAGPSRS